MIKVIVKLDGTEEPYIPHKLNGWSEWAAQELGDLVDWSSVVMEAVAKLPERVTSQELQDALIEECMSRKTWSYYLMAGRLYAVWLRKKLYGTSGIPTVKSLHTQLRKAGLMIKLDYSTKEYAEIEKFIDHDKDLNCPHFSLHHTRNKYSLRDRRNKKEYETQQFVYMRMAMTLAEKEPRESRIEHVKNFYTLFSDKILSAPTPNYVNLGTSHRGFASCCLIASGDTGESLAIGDWIGNIMTQRSAGIGINVMCRSLGDPVRNGLIIHNGKKPYYDVLGKAVLANIQAGRGGALTTYWNSFDPEGQMISQLRNARSTEDRRNRDMHYNMLTNPLFARKAANNENVFTFNVFTAPDLHAAFYSKDFSEFERLYAEYETKPDFKREYINARDLLRTVLSEGYETGTAYLSNAAEINRHTPFLEPIYSSNLCAEIMEPTKPYYNMADLYKAEDHGNGEIATCSLAALSIENIHDTKTYQLACYYALKMIDFCILNSEYAFPHLEFTAKARMSAGVGMMGVATHFARNQMRYDSEAGLREQHFLAERHMYHMLEASIKISQERGLPAWIGKTKWPQGWLPLDTYNREVDKLVPNGFDNTYDWEAMRAKIIANGGIGHSVLVAYMPGESSSKALGGTNSIYPIRRKTLAKADINLKIDWAAPYSDNPAYMYQTAWEIPGKDLISFYGVTQKWTDQGISADEYRRIIGDEGVSSNEMLKNFFHLMKVGLKTRYYINTETTANLSLEALENAFENNDGMAGCASGACAL